MLKRLSFISLIALAALWVLLGGNRVDYLSLEPQLKVSRILSSTGQALPEFALLDHHQQAFNRDRLKGRWSLVFFGYTHCPDVCPTGLMDMASIKMLLKRQGLKVPEIFFITFDPKRDTPELLKTFVTHFDQDFVGVSGGKAQIDQLIKPFGAYYERVFYQHNKPITLKPDETLPAGVDQYLINHTASIYLINPEARIVADFPAPHSPTKVVDDLTLLLTDESH